MSCHDNRQPLVSLAWLFFVCSWSLSFFLLIYQRRFWFGFFSIIFLPEYFLDQVINQQFLFLFMFPLSETGWRVEYETRSYLNASLQLRRQAFFQGKTFAGVLSGCGSWSKALVCVSVLIFVGAEPPVWLDRSGMAMDAFRGAQTSQQHQEGSISVPCIQEDLSESRRGCLPSPYFSTPLMNGTPRFSERDVTEARTSCPSSIGEDPHLPSSSLIGPCLVKWEHYLIVLSKPAGQRIQDGCPHSPLTSIPTN